MTPQEQALAEFTQAAALYLMDAWVRAAESLGMEHARAFVVQTVLGSAALALEFPDTPLEELRRNVTSPGGTTEAGLNVLMGDKAFRRCVGRATKAALNSYPKNL